MNITATHINYFHVCIRKLWLFSNGIQMEHNSQAVSEGKLIGESTYLDRPEKYTELLIDNVKIDYYDAKNKVVHEVKKSNKVEQAHEAQVKYYLYVLLCNGVEGATGIIEYPTLRHKTSVILTSEDIIEIQTWEKEILNIMKQTTIPPTINKPVCKKCSYYEFCYV
ncbi:MAG TPA: CRISPR-associated protein Cas4 [Saprospiraceae bacterium]|nr:CRISPR-associated protein Cas4 [Saprospiraceae bacterium]